MRKLDAIAATLAVSMTSFATMLYAHNHGVHFIIDYFGDLFDVLH